MFVVGGVEKLAALVVERPFDEQDPVLSRLLERQRVDIVSCNFEQEEN